MKVCIVGGNGNIGFYVAKHLLDLGHEVTCFNRGLTGSVPEGAEQIIGDRENTKDFEETIQSRRFEAGIDMTCYHEKHAASSIRAFRGVQHFINCSSIAVYGRQLDALPTDENADLKPKADLFYADYAAGKAAADKVFMQAYQETSFPVTLLLPSLSYGPKLGLVRQTGIDYSWIDRIKQGRPMVVADNGQSLHQFMHVDDMGKAFAMMLGRTEYAGEAFNISAAKPITWDVYHSTVMDVVGNHVDQIGIPAKKLEKLYVQNEIPITNLFWSDSYFSIKKFSQAIPEFNQKISLKGGVTSMLEILERESRLLSCPDQTWEDTLIQAQGNSSIYNKPKKSGLFRFWK